MKKAFNFWEVLVLGNKFFYAGLVLASVVLAPRADASLIGYADVVLDYFDSGTGPMAGPYGGTYPTGPGYPIPVSTNVVLEDDPGPTGYPDFLSLPSGSYVTVGFIDETVIDGVGNDIFVQEAGASGERANVFVSSDLINFVLLGVAADDVTTAFDLASISFSSPVQAVRIVGLDVFGASPGFDVMNVQVLPGSIGPAPNAVPEHGSLSLAAIALTALTCAGRVRKNEL
ncbi:MAG TPA: hypothetical protein VIT23_10475 [Terrimicrobiaceae bacterium]